MSRLPVPPPPSKGFLYYTARAVKCLNCFRLCYNADSGCGRKPKPSARWIKKWNYISGLHRLSYLIYILPVLLLSLICAALAALPWMLFERCRPIKDVSDSVREKHAEREALDYDSDNPDRDVLAPLGYGSEQGRGAWKGWWHRVWDMYSLVRDMIHAIKRQGLQVCSVVIALAIIYWQVGQLVHDWTGSPYDDYMKAVTSGDDTDRFNDDPTCAYISGTGIANWGSGQENFAWYTGYHCWIIVLCLLLIMDETFNVRMGLFAPQWSRAGIGYTIIFISLCVLNSSPLYGVRPLIQARYVGLMVIFFVGVFNLLKTFISGMGCIDDENYRNEAYRYGRHALRPWTEAEWKRSIGKDDFAPISPKAPQSDGQRLGTSRNRKKKKKREEKALSRTQRLQRRIGDRHWPNRRSPQLVKAYGEDGVPPHMLNEGEQYHEECVVISKTPAQRYAERGTINRGIIDWMRIQTPPFTMYDQVQRARYYICEDYDLDRYYYVTEETAASVAKRKIEPKAQPDYREVLKMPYDQDRDKGEKAFKWETKEQFAARAILDRKAGAGYYGLADWQPLPYNGQRYTYGFYYWFDMRRLYCAGIALYTILIHIMLMMYNLGFGYSQWPTYKDEYKDASAKWRANGGHPVETDCQYFKGSSMPIWIKSGQGPISGVVATMSIYVLWELFILHLCLGVLLVSLSNSRTWGMHLPWPITLIGPRTSSVSLGWTLNFIAMATMQLGFFDFNEVQLWMARLGGYGCLAGSLAFFFWNEEMRNLTVRRPFIHFLSVMMLQYMDDKKYKRDLVDCDD